MFFYQVFTSGTVATCIEGGAFWLCVGLQRQLLLPHVSFQCICTALYLHCLSRLYLHCGVFALSFICICTAASVGLGRRLWIPVRDPGIGTPHCSTHICQIYFLFQLKKCKLQIYKITISTGLKSYLLNILSSHSVSNLTKMQNTK